MCTLLIRFCLQIHYWNWNSYSGGPILCSMRTLDVIFWCCDFVIEFNTKIKFRILVLWCGCWIQYKNWISYPGAWVLLLNSIRQLNSIPCFSDILIEINAKFQVRSLALGFHIERLRSCYEYWKIQCVFYGVLILFLESKRKMNFVFWFSYETVFYHLG